jgi:prepilin-type processing-associated H-X9-DG protein
LEAYALGTLPKARAAALDAHLDVCEECRAALNARTSALRSLDVLADVEPPAGLAQAILRNIEEKQRDVPFWQSYRAVVLTSLCICILAASVLLPALSRSREAARRSSSANNLKQLGVVFRMYSNESRGGAFPPMAPGTEAWLPDLRVLYPTYLNDLSILISPSAPDATKSIEQLEEIVSTSPIDWDRANALIRESYAYLGWTILNKGQLDAVHDERIRIAKLADSQPMRNVDAEGMDSAYVLKQGIERFFITDINNPAGSAQAQSGIPVMIEVGWERNKAKGANVLFMDGHVEFVKYGQWPVVDDVLNVLRPVPGSVVHE